MTKLIEKLWRAVHIRIVFERLKEINIARKSK